MLKLAKVGAHWGAGWKTYWERRKTLEGFAREKMPVWLFYGMKDLIVHPACSELVYNALVSTPHGRKVHTTHVRRTTYRDAGDQCWG